MQLNRRDFLKLSGAAALAGRTALLQTTSRAFASQAGDLGILYDASKCVGCRACQNACRDWNGTPAEPDPTGLYDAPRKLSADTWTLIKLNKRSETDWHFMSYQCMHCADAACVTVCPTGALFKDERGFTAYDREKCNGCGYCTQFCPFGVPHLKTTSLLTGEAKAAKCTFCQDRIWGGLGGPSCAEACPVEALIWGQREELLDKAKARVAVLQDQGLSGVRLYGENETGGLHRLSILLDEPSAYGLPANPQGPITFSRVWQKIIQPLGEVALGATILGVIAAFFITRRNIRMEEVE